MKKRVCFPPNDIYCIVASSNVKGFRIPNGVANIYEQSDKASVKSKKFEFTDFRPFANSETAMDDAINHLVMLHAGQQPTAVTDIPETNSMMSSLDSIKEICKPIEQQ